jgi:hypothetical protein
MEWITEQLDRLRQDELHHCTMAERDYCSWCDGADNDEHFPIGRRIRCGKSIWDYAVEHNLTDALVGPGSCLVLYHGPNTVDLSLETPEIRERFLEMVIYEDRCDYLEEYGTAKTLKFILEYSRFPGHIDWVKQAIERFPMTEKIAKWAVTNRVFLLHVYDRMAGMGNFLYEHCTPACFAILRGFHPNPERYVERQLDICANSNPYGVLNAAARQPTFADSMAVLDNLIASRARRPGYDVSIGVMAAGLDTVRLSAYGAEHGLHWLPLSVQERQELAASYGVDLDTIPPRLVDCSPIQRFVQLTNTGLLRLKPNARCANIASHDKAGCENCCELLLIQSLKSTLQKVEPHVPYPFLE